MRIVYSAVVTAALILGGCQTMFDEMTPEEKQELVQQKSEDCKNFGYKQGTTAFAQCVQSGVQERDRDISRQRAAAAASSTVCNVVGNTVICY